MYFLMCAKWQPSNSSKINLVCILLAMSLPFFALLYLRFMTEFVAFQIFFLLPPTQTSRWVGGAVIVWQCYIYYCVDTCTLGLGIGTSWFHTIMIERAAIVLLNDYRSIFFYSSDFIISHSNHTVIFTQINLLPRLFSKRKGSYLGYEFATTL